MKFTKNSGLVKTWVSLVLTGVYTREQVPNLFNLRAVVGECLDALEAACESYKRGGANKGRTASFKLRRRKNGERERMSGTY